MFLFRERESRSSALHCLAEENPRLESTYGHDTALLLSAQSMRRSERSNQAELSLMCDTDNL
jgi:hypothetical protein